MTDGRWHVDSDIRFAVTPPAALYLDEDWFRRVAETVFARTWHVVSDAASISAKETALPITLLPGALDEPLLLTRDRKERLHCLANSCPDRGELVCTAAGPAKLLKCAAHGRTFRLDGELMEAPGFQGVLGFPSPSDSLARLPVGTWGPVVLAALAPATPFEDVVRPLHDATIPALQPCAASAQEIEASWALCVEEALRMWFADADFAATGAAAATDSRRAWLFPATFVEVSPSRLTVRSVEPIAVGRTRVRLRSFLATGEWEDTDVAWFDGARLAEQQQGLRSRSYRSGHYAPRRDRAVHHFYRLLADALARG
jgi:choline monooxygenase